MKLVYYGDPILRATASEVTTFDKALRETARRMSELMVKHKGAGLAAPQIGLGIRLIVLRFPPHEMVNPAIIDRSKETVLDEEGCLSIPGVVAHVKRAQSVLVAYRDLKGSAKTVTMYGRLARVLQHEEDHLDGVLFIDHLPHARRLMLKPKLARIVGGVV
jgi:peptide deformylase